MAKRATKGGKAASAKKPSRPAASAKKPAPTKAPAARPARTKAKAAPAAVSAKARRPAPAAKPTAARATTRAPQAAQRGKPAARTTIASRRVSNNGARSGMPAQPEPAYIPPPPQPVNSDGKPKKNLAGLNARELEHFRTLLLEKRRELVGDMRQMEGEALRSSSGTNLSNVPVHIADMGTDNYEQEFTLGLVEKDRNLLREINQALAKIQDGTYGICEGTGKAISKPRLEAQPWARFSIEYARQQEGRFRRM